MCCSTKDEFDIAADLGTLDGLTKPGPAPNLETGAWLAVTCIGKRGQPITTLVLHGLLVPGCRFETPILGRLTMRLFWPSFGAKG